MLTAFDVGIGLLVFISAILATARGLTREVLSLGTWAGSALFAVWMWQTQPEIAQGYISDERIAAIATVLVSFIVSLIVLHLITIKVADFVVDSRIGPLDRTLGFVFGGLRGIFIGVIAVVFVQWLSPNGLPEWLSDSRTLPTFSSLGDSLIVALPDNIEQQITDLLQRNLEEAGALPSASDTLPPVDGTVIPEDGTNAGEVPLPTPA